MNRIELLANDIAFLSNSKLLELVQELKDNYPTRAEALMSYLGRVETKVPQGWDMVEA